MEYENDRGVFLDIPIEQFLADFRETYPNMVALIESGNIQTTKDAFTQGDRT
jgi:hypothetical protein